MFETDNNSAHPCNQRLDRLRANATCNTGSGAILALAADNTLPARLPTVCSINRHPLGLAAQSAAPSLINEAKFQVTAGNWETILSHPKLYTEFVFLFIFFQ